jgi:hypothetical protein
MRKTLYIHIGHYKTGTTALQVMLASNPKFLARQGLIYAQAYQNFSKHSAFAFSLYKAVGAESLMHGYNRPQTPQEIWDALFDEVRTAPHPNVVISSEELMRLGTFPKAAALLKQIVASAPDINVRIIAYLRAPDSHLRSWYNQLIKMGIKTPEYNAAVPGFIEPVHYDYAQALTPWIDIFGPDAITLRPYSEASRDNDSLYRDFLSIFDVALPKRGVDLPLLDPNPRLDDRMLEMARVMQNAGVPKEVVEWTTIRAHAYYEDETAGVDKDQVASFERVRQRVTDGLEALKDLPGNTVDLAAYQTRLPETEETEIAETWRMAGLLLNEVHVLRQRLIRENADITARLRRLEDQLGLDGRPSE